MESIELGYFIEPPRAREKVKRAAKNIELDHSNGSNTALFEVRCRAKRAVKSIELGYSIVPPMALKSKESSEEHRA